MLVSRAAATASLERGYAAPTRNGSERAKPARVRDAAEVEKRRTASELRVQSEQLYEVIATHRGEGEWR